MMKNVIGLSVCTMLFSALLCHAGDMEKTQQIVNLSQLLDRNDSLVAAVKDSLGRYAVLHPADTNDSIARVRIDEEAANFSGGLRQPVTNNILIAFINTNIKTTIEGRNEFFVTFRTDKQGAVKSVFIGLWDGKVGSGRGTEFILRRNKDKYEIVKSSDNILLD